MKRNSIPLVVLVLGMIATNSLANPLPELWCDWENGETIAFAVGTGVPPILATNAIPPVLAPGYGSQYSLRLEDNSPSGTPYAVIAYFYNLNTGDEIKAGFWRYDTTPAAAPSCRIWGHWNDSLPQDIEANDGSAGGNSDYGNGTGWEYTEHTWIVPAGHTGLAIEVRTYSNAGDVVWIDNLQILSFGSNSTIWTPCLGEIVDTKQASFDALKSLYR